MLALAVPEALFALPLAAYDLACCPRRLLPAMPAAALVASWRAPGLPRCGEGSDDRLCRRSTALLAWRTGATRAQRAANLRERDDLAARSQALEMQNRDLRDKRELEVRLAVLEERSRIAREIHDNVGHLLTRAHLQAQAYQVVFAQDERVRSAFEAVGESLSEALDTVRTSVHDLHDDHIDLAAQIERIAAESGLSVRCRLEATVAPPQVAACLRAVTREALSNVARHADVRDVALTLAEHPGFLAADHRERWGLGRPPHRRLSGGGTRWHGPRLARGARAGARRHVSRRPHRRGRAGRRLARIRQHPQTAGGMMRVAIIDDDALVCESLGIILGAEGDIEVVGTGADGDAAVRLFAEAAPDIVLMDIQMPGRDGLSAAQEILGRDPAARIVFLTTFSDDEYIVRALALGARGYLIKQDIAAVAPALRAVMGGQSVLEGEVLARGIVHEHVGIAGECVIGGSGDYPSHESCHRPLRLPDRARARGGRAHRRRPRQPRDCAGGRI